MLKDVLLINPPFSAYGGVRGQGGKSAPLNLAYLASFLRQKSPGRNIRIIDAEGLDWPLSRVYSEACAFRPDVIGVTCPTPVYHVFKEMCHGLKERLPEVPIVLGGPHPTVLPRETLTGTRADIIVVGEGEVTFSELLEALENNQGIEEINGLAFKKDSEIVITPKRELIPDLDVLPFPAKELLPLHLYYLPPTKRIRSERATNMVTSRGCPFACTFCMARTFWGRRVRLRSIPNVLDEIQECVDRYRLTEFSFHDEYLTFDRSSVIEFCKGILERNLDISWACQARAGSVDAEILSCMRKAGCGIIGFGFESGNQRILNSMKKKEKLEHAVEAVRLCNEAGIDVQGAFILGHPGETTESIQDTIRFARNLDLDTVAFYIAIPYPGTELYEIARKNGYLRKDLDWKMFTPVSNMESPMILPDLSPQELQRWKRKAYTSFYLRPKYIVRRIKKLRGPDDLKNVIRGLKIFWRVI